MFDDPIRPIHSVRAVEDVSVVGLRRKPPKSQLRAWLSFAKRVAKRSGQATAQADSELVAETHRHSDHQLDIEV